MRDRAREDFAQDPDAKALSATAREMEDAPYRDWMKLVREASRVAGRSDAYRFKRFYQYVGGHEIFVRGICAIEECNAPFAEDDRRVDTIIQTYLGKDRVKSV